MINSIVRRVKVDDGTYDTTKKLHVALYERRINQFSSKYGLKMNLFNQKKRRNINNVVHQTDIPTVTRSVD